jgi:hypothetical protein
VIGAEPPVRLLIPTSLVLIACSCAFSHLIESRIEIKCGESIAQVEGNILIVNLQLFARSATPKKIVCERDYEQPFLIGYDTNSLWRLPTVISASMKAGRSMDLDRAWKPVALPTQYYMLLSSNQPSNFTLSVQYSFNHIRSEIIACEVPIRFLHRDAATRHHQSIYQRPPLPRRRL